MTKFIEKEIAAEALRQIINTGEATLPGDMKITMSDDPRHKVTYTAATNSWVINPKIIQVTHKATIALMGLLHYAPGVGILNLDDSRVESIEMEIFKEYGLVKEIVNATEHLLLKVRKASADPALIKKMEEYLQTLKDLE